jgi:hypothetical protein
MRKYPLLGLALLGLTGAMVPAFATITYDCDPTSFAADGPAGTCNALNGSTVSGIYSSIFSNINATIFIKYGNTGVGESSVNVTSITYAQYYAALSSHTDDPGALATLSSASDPLVPYGNTNENIDITATLASSLGIMTNGANTAGVEADGMTSCMLGTSGCYSGVITISTGTSFYYPLVDTDPPQGPSQVDFFYVVEHETDEILGTISCISTDTDNDTPEDGCNLGSTDASPADLFRYSATPGVRSFLTTDTGSNAYFSNDGGVTDIAQYNNSPDAEDYGDWLNGSHYEVQDAGAAPASTLDISTDGGSEIAVLDAVGFNLVAPEPSTFALLGASLAALALIRWALN